MIAKNSWRSSLMVVALLLASPLLATATAEPAASDVLLVLSGRMSRETLASNGAVEISVSDEGSIVHVPGDASYLQQLATAQGLLVAVEKNDRTALTMPLGSTWDGSTWDGSTWDGSTWDGSTWDGSTWDGSTWDGSTWDGSTWDASAWGTMDGGYPAQWGLGAVNAPDAWNVTRGTDAVTVCVLDTGVEASHPDLAGRLWTDASGAVGYNAMSPGSPPTDDVGHGTHMAGVLGAAAGNGIGVAGVANVRILPVKVMGPAGGTEADLVEGLAFCRNAGARVASMSLHLSEDSPAVAQAIADAQAAGMLVVAASGNDGGAINLPAAYPGVLAVGAVAPNATVPAFSNRGSELALVAPGVKVGGTYLNASYIMGTGTSQAVPFVAGAAALVWEMRPAWSASDVSAHLKATARDLGPTGRDDVHGSGALDVGAAVAALAG